MLNNHHHFKIMNHKNMNVLTKFFELKDFNLLEKGIIRENAKVLKCILIRIIERTHHWITDGKLR